MSKKNSDNFEESLQGLKNSFSPSSNFLRKLNPCVKILALLIFVLTVVSIDKYDFSKLLIFLAIPIFCGAFLNISKKEILLKALPAIFLAGCAGFANLFFDTKTAFSIFSVPVSFGVISFSSLILKAYLCVSCAIILANTTSPNDIAYALGKFKVPCVIVLQILMTSRYLSVIIEEAMRISRAYALRSPSHPRIKFQHFPNVLLSLLLRSVDRANRIYKAMQCRGFSARSYQSKNIPFFATDAIFLILFCAFCVFCKIFNISNFLGRLFE